MQLIFLKEDKVNQFKGDCIEVRASSTPFTGKEPDHFIMIDIPSLPMTSYEHYNNAWDRIIDYEIVNQDLSLDGFRIRLFSSIVSPSGFGKITKDEVVNFIHNWGGSVFDFGDNEVIFDITISDAIESQGFWEVPIGGVVFNEINYDQGTGIHTIEIDYNSIGNNPTYIERFIANKGGVILSNNNKRITAELTRTDVRNEFENDIKQKAKQTIAVRQYYVSSAVIDNIIGQGGTTETDISTLLGYLQDKTQD